MIKNLTNKYFSYYRVSSKKQEATGASLEAQQDANKRYADENGFKIVREFREVQSAAKTGRKQFIAMVREIHRLGDIEGVIFHDVDRSARSWADWAIVDELIEEGYRIHFSREKIELNSRSSRLAADFKQAVAVDYTRNLRQETRKGMTKRLEQGYWVFGHAVVGYRTVGNGIKENDPNTDYLIRKCFELYATDKYTLDVLADEMYRLGLRSVNGKRLDGPKISRILNNKIYIGLMEVKDKIYEGRHKPIVTIQLFDKVQQVLKRRYNPDRERHKYKFQHMFKCGYCGGSVRVTKSKGKYLYYFCRKSYCESKSVTEGNIEGWIIGALRKIQFTDKQVEEMLEYVRNSKKSLRLAVEEKKKTIKLRFDQVKNKLGLLVDAYVDGKIDEDIYDKKRVELTIQVKQAEDELGSLENKNDDKLRALEELANLLRDPVYAYNKANNYEKRHLIESIMKNILLFNDQIKYEWQTPFDAVFKAQNSSFKEESRDGATRGNRTLVTGTTNQCSTIEL